MRILECIPNFSEGRDLTLIRSITDIIESVDFVRLLHVDPGKDTNRTVVTFAGDPDAVVEAAFRAVKKASELIDMSKHKGAHPRFGATDVLPLVPVEDISMEETVEYARKLGKRIGEELGIPVYCYENAAFTEKRKNLAFIRSGEYEGLKKKLANPDWKPDFGPAVFNKKSGAVAVGARDFLVAFNINLNTTSVRRANAIAFDLREKGRIKREGDKLTGNIIRDDKGDPVYIPGSLKSVKAIGWFLDEYGIAQISMNLTNISITPVHIAFDEACRRAEARGIRVTGSELAGMIPLKALLEAGKYFLKKQKRSTGISDKEILKIAIKSLGLNDLYPFRPEEKILEYRLRDLSGTNKKLTSLSLRDFVDETASESPAPGGGTISACMGSFGAALAAMVANLSAHKRGWDDRWEEFSEWAEKAKEIQNELLFLAEEDTLAFKKLMEAYSLPKSTEAETIARDQAICKATIYCIDIPFRVMKTAFSGFDIIDEMVEKGNPGSLSDAAVGALALRSSVLGAWLNISINISNLRDKKEVEEIQKEGEDIVQKAMERENAILMKLKMEKGIG